METKDVAKADKGRWWRWVADKMVGAGLWRIVDWLWAGWLGKGISLMVAFATWILTRIESYPVIPSFLVSLVALALSLFIANEVQTWRDRKSAKRISQQEHLEPPKIIPVKEEERLTIGANLKPYIDKRGYELWEMYLPVFNHGATDRFRVQIVRVNPPPPEQATFPWSIQWEDEASEFIEIVRGQDKTLRFCRMDLGGEFHDPQTGKWRPARILFFTLKQEKEVFLPVVNWRGVEDLYNLKIDCTFRITLQGTKEKIMWQFVIGFEQGKTQPYVVRNQHI